MRNLPARVLALFSCTLAAAALALPTVSLTSPTASQYFAAPGSITLRATATPTSGSAITKVEFYRGGSTLIGTVTGSTTPHVFNWNGATAGAFRLTAVVTDSRGLATTSACRDITVVAPHVAPTATLTAPATGAVFTAPATVELTAATTQPGESIKRVEFYNGATKIGEDATPPYTYTWADRPPGAYLLKGVAVDNADFTGSSAWIYAVVDGSSYATPAFALARTLALTVLVSTECFARGPLEQETLPTIQLGRQLFFDKQLSADATVSCATCHRPELAFSDGLQVSLGSRGQASTRNAPSIIDAARNRTFFWDGRQTSLEGQILEPFVNEREHGLASLEALTSAVEANPSYRAQFQSAFPAAGVTPQGIAASIAIFIRSLGKGTSRFDRYWSGKDKGAISEVERRGLEVFNGPAHCSACHLLGKGDVRLTDDSFHSIGIGLDTHGSDLVTAARQSSAINSSAELSRLISSDPATAALGRFNVTKKLSDMGRFRTPSLRNVAVTAPYMHDGSVSTLESAVDRELYYRSASQGRPVTLTPDEKANLLAFLRALTTE